MPSKRSFEDYDKRLIETLHQVRLGKRKRRIKCRDARAAHALRQQFYNLRSQAPKYLREAWKDLTIRKVDSELIIQLKDGAALGRYTK